MKPNLAYKVDPHLELEKLVFPLYGAPKLDGIRTLVRDDGFVSRKLKRIPNEYTQATLWSSRIVNMDGELILGDPTDDPFRRTSSAVMTKDGEPKLTLWVFDDFMMGGQFHDRYTAIKQKLKGRRGVQIELVEHKLLKNLDVALDYEAAMLKAGYEGIMLRSPTGRYKYGRSTLKEQGLVALKRFKDSEAVVLAMLPRMKNNNEATVDETGASKRSSHKANKAAQDTLGAMVVRDIHTGVEFELGMGRMTMAEAKAAWDEYHEAPFAFKDKRLAKYKYFPVGAKDKPRLPTWIGWRDPRDC